MQGVALSLVELPKDFRDTTADMKLASYLSYAVPTERAADVAYDLIRRYRTIDKLLRLSYGELRAIPGVCAEVVDAINLLYSIHISALREKCDDGALSQNTQTICDYCRLEFRGSTTAEFKIFFGRDDRLIHESAAIKGQVDVVALYPREILKEALNIDANSIYVVFGRAFGENGLNKLERRHVDNLKVACSHLEVSFLGAGVVLA